jgi:hypothetical protein
MFFFLHIFPIYVDLEKNTKDFYSVLFGNPIHHTGTAGSYGSGGHDTTTLQGVRHDVTGTGAHGVSGKLHRSGSSSSSSVSLSLSLSLSLIYIYAHKNGLIG